MRCQAGRSGDRDMVCHGQIEREVNGRWNWAGRPSRRLCLDYNTPQSLSRRRRGGRGPASPLPRRTAPPPPPLLNPLRSHLVCWVSRGRHGPAGVRVVDVGVALLLRGHRGRGHGRRVPRGLGARSRVTRLHGVALRHRGGDVPCARVVLRRELYSGWSRVVSRSARSVGPPPGAIARRGTVGSALGVRVRRVGRGVRPSVPVGVVPSVLVAVGAGVGVVWPWRGPRPVPVPAEAHVEQGASPCHAKIVVHLFLSLERVSYTHTPSPSPSPSPPQRRSPLLQPPFEVLCVFARTTPSSVA